MRMIQRRTKMVIAVLFMLVLVGMFDTSVQAATNYTQKVTKKNADFTISAEYGLNGLVYYDTPTMVSVTVECKENFTGTLQLIPAVEYNSTKVAYGEDISLSAGESKTFYYVPSSIGSNGEVDVVVLNEKGKVAYSEKHQLMLENGGSKVSIGILSDDYGAFSYFDGVEVNIQDGNQGLTSIFELTKDSLPNDAMGLAMLQYMVIDNYDTAHLSKEQYEALKTWVQNGGVLILGLGSNYQNVLHGFQDSFVSGTIGTLEKKEVSFDSLEEVTNIIGLETSADDTTEEQITNTTDEQPTDATKEDIEESVHQELDSSLELDCLGFELEGGEPFSEYTTAGTAYKKDVGKGRVVVLGYSMGMEPMTSFSHKKSIVKFLVETALTEATQNKFYGNGNYSSPLYNGLEVAKLADDARKPSVLMYGFILLVYVILVGPILYVILKAKNKREKIWIVIPLVSLAFTGVIYLTGFLYRINKPLVSTFTVIQLQKNAKTENVYTNILCPKPKEYRVQFAKEYTGFQRNTNEYSYSVFDTEESSTTYDYMLKKNSKGTEITLDHTEPFQNTSFVINRSSENNIGTLDHDITCYTTGFEGTVTNNTCYDLQHVMVTFENYIYLVGDMKKGETVDIDSDKVMESSAYGSFENLYPTNRLYTDRELYSQYQASNMIETNLIDKTAYGTGYIWARVASYKPEVTEDTNVKRSGFGVLLASYEAEYEDVKGAFYPTIDGMAIASQGEYDDYDRSIYSSEVIITYSFENDSGITCLENMSMGSSNSSTYNLPADVYAYNIQTGTYDQIFTDSNVLQGEELKKYMLENVIMLKYMQQTSGYGAYIPRISARGEQ